MDGGMYRIYRSNRSKYINLIHSTITQKGGHKSNPFIRQSNNTKILSINPGIIESQYDIKDIDTIHFEYMYPLFMFLKYVDKLNNILFVGLGGGHMPLILRKYFKDLQINVVEIEPRVLPKAQEMGFVQDSKMNIYFMDAKDYFDKFDKFDKFDNKTPQLYDAIVIDTVQSAEITFDYNKIKSFLTDTGILAINSCLDTDKDILSPQIKRSFEFCKILSMPNHKIYFCSKSNISNKDIYLKKLRDHELIIENTSKLKTEYNTCSC